MKYNKISVKVEEKEFQASSSKKKGAYASGVEQLSYCDVKWLKHTDELKGSDVWARTHSAFDFFFFLKGFAPWEDRFSKCFHS